MHIAPSGNGIRRFSDMANGGQRPAEGLDPRHLQPYDVGGVLAGVPFKVKLVSAVGATDVDAFHPTNGIPFPAEVLGAAGYMTGAGAAGDTIQVRKNTTAITDAVDVALFSDKDKVDFATFDDAQVSLAKGDNLRLTTVSDALCVIWVELVRVSAY